jgi:hypothetical protein
MQTLSIGVDAPNPSLRIARQECRHSYAESVLQGCPEDQPAGSVRRGSVRLPKHPDEHRPERPVLLALDQQLGEGRLCG